jgi:alkyl hydroperoxide reductase subunit AhpC
MITEKTVFILGAGASCPYGFPSGAQLRKEICFDFPDKYSRFLINVNSHDNLRVEGFRNFVEKFFKSSTKSIDLFLARNPNFAELGKYVIAFEMLNAEVNSHFNEQSKNDGKEDWLFYLFDRMTDTIKDKTQIKKFSENNISFITFNYDRSLEHFFFTSLRNSFDVPEYEVLNILRQLKIIHVYGSLAPLDWQDGKHGIQYGQKASECVLQNISQNLRTIYEEKQNPELNEVKSLIVGANKVFFLGFGYAEENMNILGLPQIIPLNSIVYGTGYGLEKKEIEKIYNGMWNGLKEHPETAAKNYFYKIEIENKHCLELLRNYL